MNFNKKINQVYNFYSQWKYDEAKKLNDEILQKDPKNIYAIRYKKIIEEKLKNKIKTSNKDKVRIKWKVLKCPHCLARIPFSYLNTEQKDKIKTWKYNNLEIKCPYCHTSFILQKRKAFSSLWLKIWDIANIDWKKYRVTWYVDYLWNWYEGNYSWKLSYLEWILLWEKGDYKYFSEGSFYDDWNKNEEFEISQKIIPKFSLKPNYSENYISINNKKIYFKEKNIVSVKSLYGENSKIYTIWEKVELYEFSFKWKNYLIEKEWTWIQKEAWIYETKKISKKEAFNLFWKKYNDNFYIQWENFNSSIIFYLTIWIFIAFDLFVENGWNLTFAWYFIWIIFIWFVIWNIFQNFENKVSKNIMLIFILVPILSFLYYYLFNNILDNKKEISLKELHSWKKIRLEFENPNFFKEKVVWRTKYDYWWIKTYYETNVWLKFSIKNENDKKILKKIKNIVNWNVTYWNSYNEEKIKEMFKQWKIYLIRKD
jgi:hypothetical protein